MLRQKETVATPLHQADDYPTLLDLLKEGQKSAEKLVQGNVTDAESRWDENQPDPEVAG